MSALRAASLALLAAHLVVTPAEANGKFPEAGQLVTYPSDPSRIAVVTTFGVIVTDDGGLQWDVICEPGAGYADVEPPITVAPTGALVLGTFNGVTVSSPDGCDFGAAGGVAELVPDVTSSPGGAAVVAAVTYDAEAAQGAYVTSLDGGMSFAASSGALEPGFVPLTVDLAVADGSRVYVSGVRGDPARGALARSADGGATWDVVDIAGSEVSSWPYIGAIDPIRPDVLYVRLHTDPGRLLLSRDGGDTFTEIFSGPGYLRGLAVSPDGSQIAVGNEDGVWRAPTRTLEFEKVASTAVMCLTWRARGLFACGHQFLNDGFAVALSDDDGASFQSLVSFSCLRGVLACDASGSVGQACPSEWPMLSSQLGTHTCGADVPPASAVTTGSGAGPSPSEPSSASSGCSCRLGEPQGLGYAPLLALTAACGWRRRRSPSRAA